MKCVIVGGGISGLSLAWELVRDHPERRDEILLLEASDRPGGKIGTDRAHGLISEWGPNGFLDNNPSTLELCRSLGLEDLLRKADAASAHRYLFLGDRLIRLPAKPLEFLRSDVLSLRGRLRVLVERFIPKRSGDADESITAFGYRRVGKEATDILLGALVSGIYAGDPGRLSLPSCFPRIAELEAKYGSLIRAQVQLARERRKEAKIRSQKGDNATSSGPAGPSGPGGTLHTLVGGMGTLVERLAERLGDVVQLNRPVHRLERNALAGTGPRLDAIWAPESRGDTTVRWRVVTEAGAIETESVVLACPPAAQTSLLRSVDAELAGEVAGIESNVAVVVCLAFRKRDLGSLPIGFGYLSPEMLRRPVLGVIWSSYVFPEQSPPDLFQFRAILGGWHRRDVLDWDDDRLERETRTELAASLGISAEPVHRTIIRWRDAIPQYHVGHAARLARIADRLQSYPGLVLSGNGYRGVAVNDCVAESRRIAEQQGTTLFTHPRLTQPG